MKSRDRLSSLQVFVTCSVKLLPVNSLHFLLSIVRKRSYCRWCSFTRIVSWHFELAFYCHRLCSIFIEMSRKCVNNPDNFCYICGEVTFASRKRRITPTIKKAYFLYFGCKLGDQDKKWAPHVCCITCSSKLNAWVNGKGRCMPFGVPMVWRVPSNHTTDCYFCMVPPIQNGVFMRKKSTLVCPNVPSAIWPVPHGDGRPVPEPPDNFAVYSDDDDTVSSNSKEQQSSASRDAD